MNKVAIAFSTKDRVELSQQAVVPLLRPDLFDLFWVDGSNTLAGQELNEGYSHGMSVRGGVRGGADAAIVYSLTEMLKNPQFEYVGLVENDVLLHSDWFGPTMALFERGKAEGLEVGAVSARCYEDRILFQRDGYAVTHNTGAGMVIFTREAAELVLENFRTGWWAHNRRIFMQLSGLDIGKWAAFRANEQWTTADWHFDATLAELGIASLALTPSPVEMIGQIPSLHEQGLKLATTPVELLRNDKAFDIFRVNLERRRFGAVKSSNCSQFHQMDDGTWIIFPHQVAAIGGKYQGDWKLKWSQGFGPFAWQAGEGARIPTTLTARISGPCTFMVSGGEAGGRVEIEDLHSGYKVTPELPAEGPTTQVLNLPVPGHVSYREVRLTMHTPGTRFYGIQTREAQPWLPAVKFIHATLPPP